jgi:mRNA-degrading endonuclease RelE of RelBE toxin-antitoxin system
LPDGGITPYLHNFNQCVYFAMFKQKIAITPVFLEALSKLSKADQQRVQNTIIRLSEEPGSTGLRRHKLGGGNDYVSLSSGMDIRILTLFFNNATVLIYVDHHDAAYRWSASHKVIVDENSSFLEIIPTVSHESPLLTNLEQINVVESSEYGRAIAERLLSYDLPAELLYAIRSVNSEDALFGFISDISPWLQEIIIDAAADMEQEKIKQINQVPSIIVLQDDDELINALKYPLEKWRWFLHPMQQRLVNADANKKIAIIAGPGTGKTITLVHRAVHLDGQHKKVLLLTKSQSLATVLVDMLAAINPVHHIYVGYLIETRDHSLLPNFIIHGSQFAHCHTLPSSPIQPKESAPFVFLLRKSDDYPNKYCLIDHVLIDEAQDLGDKSQLWLERLTQDNEIGFTVSIDFDQAIVSHNVGKLNGLLESDRIAKEHLSYSYRLTREILKYARSCRGPVIPMVKAIEANRDAAWTAYDAQIEKTKTLAALSRQDHSVLFYGLCGNEIEKISCSKNDLDAELSKILLRLRQQYQNDDIAILLQLDFAFFDFSKEVSGKKMIDFKAAKGREWFAGVVVVDNEWLRLLEDQKLSISENNLTRINAFYVALTRFREQVTVLSID